MANVESKQVIELTPEIMAKAFWGMCSSQQADFLEELAKVIKADHASNGDDVGNCNAYGLGELQWCYLKDELRKPGREIANDMHMAFSAFAYDFWPQKINGARDGLES